MERIQGGIKAGEVPPIIYAATNVGKSMFASSREKIEQHLIKQKARAVQAFAAEFSDLGSTASRCQYRTNEGRMCAAGCLIEDDKYVSTMEGKTVFLLQDSHPGVFPDDITLRELEKWQAYHDHSCMLAGKGFQYGAWCEGNEDHHPSKFKAALDSELGE